MVISIKFNFSLNLSEPSKFYSFDLTHIFV